MHRFAARLGDRGPVVADVRDKLALVGLLDADGAPADPQEARFDHECEQAVRTFQQQRGLTADGVVGPATYRSLDEARWRLGERILSSQGSRPVAGDDVAGLQRRLLDLGFAPGRIDGRFGADTDAAVREFQRNVGLLPDGICGPATFKAFDRLSCHVTGGRPDVMREQEKLAASQPSLHGKVIIIDPGHGGADRGVVVRDASGPVDEASLVEDLAARLEGRLAATGVLAYLSRPLSLTGEPPTESDRAAFANTAGADLLISLHADGASSASAAGVATYYYGADRYGHVSEVGAQLADLITHEIVSRTGMTDCRSHAKSWELLRHTRMPAVRVEVGYLTSPADRARLRDGRFRDQLADAIAAAMRTLYRGELATPADRELIALAG